MLKQHKDQELTVWWYISSIARIEPTDIIAEQWNQIVAGLEIDRFITISPTAVVRIIGRGVEKRLAGSAQVVIGSENFSRNGVRLEGKSYALGVGP